MYIIALIAALLFSSTVLAGSGIESPSTSSKTKSIKLSLNSEIRYLTAYQKKMEESAARAGVNNFPEGAGNNLDSELVNKYTCYGLRILLGMSVAPLRPKVNTSLDFYVEGDAPSHYKDMGDALSALASLQNITQKEAATIYNLDCGSSSHKVASNHFKVSDDTLIVLGDIDAGFYEKFAAQIKKHKNIKTVALGSGGGKIVDAVAAGMLIRLKGLETVLHNNCYSACTLVFMGGVIRSVWPPFPVFGFHQASSSNLINGKIQVVPIPFDAQIYELIMNYARAMDVNPAWLYRTMLKAPPDKMHILRTMEVDDAKELCDSGYTTWIKYGCSSPE